MKKIPNEPKNEVFQSIIILTQNILEEIRHISSKKNIPVGYLDFKLLEINTLFRTNKEEEWEVLDQLKSNVFESDVFFTHANLEIAQEYRIEIYDRRACSAFPLKIKLGANKDETKVVATIEKSVEIKYYENLEEDMTNEINKKKIRAGLLVGIREGEMNKNIRAVIHSIQQDGFLKENATFAVMHGVKPISTINSDIIYHYKNKLQQEDQYGRIDHSKRGYLLTVKKGDMVMEAIMPQEGRAGRTCKGVYISVEELKPKNNQVDTTNAFEVRHGDKSIQYIAKKSGYIKESRGTYDIQDQISLDEVSFKSTGSIEAGIDNNVSINVREIDDTKDTIGVGVAVEACMLKIEGSVADSAHVVAKEVSVGGQTHKTSMIEADTVSIAVHRGEARGKEIEVDRLEGGVISGDVVKIKFLLGGKVMGRKIYVQTLMSNSSIVASELVEIEKIEGTENKIEINPGKIENLDILLEKLKKSEKEYNQVLKKIEEKKKFLDKNIKIGKDIKNKILELRSKKADVPRFLIKKLKEFQSVVDSHNSLLRKAKSKEKEIEDVKKKIDEYQEKIYNAKIINHSTWTEHNHILFASISPKFEVLHLTKKDELSKKIILQKTQEGENIIERSNVLAKD